jgi:hypothetical protein
LQIAIVARIFCERVEERRDEIEEAVSERREKGI